MFLDIVGNKPLVSRPENSMCIKTEFRILLYFKNSYQILQLTSAGPSQIQKYGYTWKCYEVHRFCSLKYGIPFPKERISMPLNLKKYISTDWAGALKWGFPLKGQWLEVRWMISFYMMLQILTHVNKEDNKILKWQISIQKATILDIIHNNWYSTAEKYMIEV